MNGAIMNGKGIALTMFARAALALLAVSAVNAQVTFDRILHADKEPQNWLTYSGTTLGQRYSPLKQITPDNVSSLTMQWAFQARSTEKFESTPLVVDGMMYVTQAPNDVVALDAATGEIKWLYSYAVSRDARPCCGRINRGLAILGNTLYMAPSTPISSRSMPTTVNSCGTPKSPKPLPATR